LRYCLILPVLFPVCIIDRRRRGIKGPFSPRGEQAIRMLAGTQDSAEFVKEYCRLCRSGAPIEQALVLVGHEFRLRQPEYQLALR
jgi:hypothetical protein